MRFNPETQEAVGEEHVFPPNEVLESAMDKLESVVVIGVVKDRPGQVFVASSNGASKALELIYAGGYVLTQFSDEDDSDVKTSTLQ